MRMSRLLIRTLREPPADAEAASHQLLVRAGYIRRLASGIYTFLPLGHRVIRNLERIIREEMDAAGAQELLMPVLQPFELWEQSGRVALLDEAYGAFHVEGRGGHFVLGPTHEEVVTETVSAEVVSERDLPKTVYQIQAKFRDEARPRYGLLRGREFLMKDAYSFDLDQDRMRASYQAMYDAYGRIFKRCGLVATPVEASSGAFGGSVNHEFMVETAIGEDLFARCTDAGCGYAANIEAAESAAIVPALRYVGNEPLVEHHTPGRPGIDLVVEFFTDRRLTAAGMLKCIAVLGGDDRPVVVLVPGNRQVRIPPGMRPFEDADFDAHPYLVKGYIGPMGLQEHGVRVLADGRVQTQGPWVTGANKADHHVTGAILDRDFTVDEWGSYATVEALDTCARCSNGNLELVRAVEAGHTFQLGNRYSERYWMGCYGIGVSRLMAVVAETHHDDGGLAWPEEIAPFQVHLLTVGAARSPEVTATADRLYDELAAAQIPTLYDDRRLSPGVTFADADLLGIPLQLIVGAKGLARGVVETKDRATGDRDEIPADQAVYFSVQFLSTR